MGKDRAVKRGPEIRKAGRLGNDRPSLGARLGWGVEALGCVGRGLREAVLGNRRRAMGNSGVEREGRCLMFEILPKTNVVNE